METSLREVILSEGTDLYREIRTGRADWERIGRTDGPGTDAKASPQGLPRTGQASSPLHAYYPFLFHTCFQDVPRETVRELSRADRLYAEHLLSYDRMLDRHRSVETAELFLAQQEHVQSLKLLHTLFAVGHPFWDYFTDCYFETWRSVREERLWHSHRIGPFPIRRFCALAKGKTAVLRPFSMALAFLARRTRDLARLSASLDLHHIALVCIDDLEDWRQDFRNFNFTYLLTRLVHRVGLAETLRSGHPVPTERIGRLLYATGLAEKQLRLAEIFFQKSNETVGSLPLPLWKQFNDGFRRRCRALRHDLAEIRRREQGRARVRASGTVAETIVHRKSFRKAVVQQIRSGISFLAERQAKDGIFPLAVSPHIYLCPSRPAGASRAATTLILTSLEALEPVDSSVHALIRSASCALSRMDDKVTHPGRPRALEDAFQPIPSDPLALSRIERSFAPGHGPLPDGLFWANFLYHCSGRSFRVPRLKAFAADCILRQHYTPWSHGTAFGPVPPPWTRYACKPLLPLLLLCRALRTQVPRKRLEDYLVGRGQPRESWNSSTEIALTLLCLRLTDGSRRALSRAVRKLSESQEPDGSWAPNAVFREGTAYYGGRELTTAWCIEALYRCHSRGVQGS
jgi:hypothetical protein